MNDSFFYPYVTKQVGGWTSELSGAFYTSVAVAVIGVLVGAVAIIRILKKGEKAKEAELQSAGLRVLLSPRHDPHRGGHGVFLLG